MQSVLPITSELSVTTELTELSIITESLELTEPFGNSWTFEKAGGMCK